MGSLSLLMLGLLLVPSAVRGQEDVQVDFSNTLWTPLNNAQLLNDPQDPTKRYVRLTAATNGQQGQVWLTQPVRILDFTVTFHFVMSDSSYYGSSKVPADGLCFVVQNQQFLAESSGGGLGYDGIPSSIAVCVDTFSLSIPFVVTTNFFGNGTTQQFYDNNRLGWDPVDNQRHKMTVTYRRSTGILSWTITRYVTGTAYSFSYNLGDITNYVRSQNAWIGWTGSTGGFFASHDIFSPSWESICTTVFNFSSLVSVPPVGYVVSQPRSDVWNVTCDTANGWFSTSPRRFTVFTTSRLNCSLMNVNQPLPACVPPSSTSTPSPSTSRSPSFSASATRSRSASPSVSASFSRSPSVSSSRTASSSISATVTRSPVSPSLTPSSSISPSVSPSRTVSPTSTPLTPSNTPSLTATTTGSPSRGVAQVTTLPWTTIRFPVSVAAANLCSTPFLNKVKDPSTGIVQALRRDFAIAFGCSADAVKVGQVEACSNGDVLTKDHPVNIQPLGGGLDVAGFALDGEARSRRRQRLLLSQLDSDVSPSPSIGSLAARSRFLQSTCPNGGGAQGSAIGEGLLVVNISIPSSLVVNDAMRIIKASLVPPSDPAVSLGSASAFADGNIGDILSAQCAGLTNSSLRNSTATGNATASMRPTLSPLALPPSGANGSPVSGIFGNSFLNRLSSTLSLPREGMLAALNVSTANNTRAESNRRVYMVDSALLAQSDNGDGGGVSGGQGFGIFVLVAFLASIVACCGCAFFAGGVVPCLQAAAFVASGFPGLGCLTAPLLRLAACLPPSFKAALAAARRNMPKKSATVGVAQPSPPSRSSSAGSLFSSALQYASNSRKSLLMPSRRRRDENEKRLEDVAVDADAADNTTTKMTEPPGASLSANPSAAKSARLPAHTADEDPASAAAGDDRWASRPAKKPATSPKSISTLPPITGAGPRPALVAANSSFHIKEFASETEEPSPYR